MGEFSERGNQDNEKPQYAISENIQAWMDAYFIKMAADEITQEEYRALQSEYEKLAKENAEYKLALLRRYEPESGDTYRLEQELMYDEKLRREKADAEQAEKTPVNPENNIFTHYEDTLNRMAIIEGPGWKAGQEACDENKRDSLKAALAFIKKHRKSKADVNVHGSGGWNRWKVNTDGSVEFSEHHATSLNDERIPSKERTIVRVKLLGFKVF